MIERSGREDADIVLTPGPGNPAHILPAERGLEPMPYMHDVMLCRPEGVDPKLLTPREWQAPFSAEVPGRPSSGEISAKLAPPA